MKCNQFVLYINIYRSIKKVISLRNISKVFSHFSYTLMVYVYITCNLILVPFCFYKSYLHITRQHLYINIKYIQIKKTTTYFKYIPMKTQLQCTLHHYVYIYRCISLCFNKICNSPWYCIVRFLQDAQCYTIPRFPY